MRKGVMLPLLLLLGCTASNSPVETYLEALKAGDANKAADQLCVPGDYKSSPLTTASSWEVLSEEKVQQEGVNVAVTTVKVTSPALGGNQTKEWKIESKDVNDAFKLAGVANQKMAELGVTPVPLNRDEWKKSGQCITFPVQ